MARQVFDFAESAGIQLTESPKIDETNFGDGYVQASPQGLNFMPQEWRVPFRAVGRTGGDDIVAFFRAHGGWQVFDWTPRWATSPIQVVCKTWSRSQLDDAGLSDIEATFTQRFVFL